MDLKQKWFKILLKQVWFKLLLRYLVNIVVAVSAAATAAAVVT